jgi:hypothetical protein
MSCDVNNISDNIKKEKSYKMHERKTAYIINCGYCADNKGYCSASASVLCDRKVPRIPKLIIYAER